ncbi:RNA 2',3'-cyclic phosphodiesterase [Desulfovibrio sp. TomC]|uniref:RNA 2',3'-cyclic phosphodiesterase n=1 Tax=Desulfovibrio sp. TomC TaxID=1562888 RepID=UPI0005735612|nr:RNA 2',3'-cyclic phosphodiesterase [Desulfovibrio sp. TomC]KHK01069.1 2'-5' RNA ligase [Desulfovibrio sp. TomC]
METQRLFVGIELPPAHQALVAGLVDQLRARVGAAAVWTREGNAHITLKFLGDVARERLEAVTTALAAIPFAPFVLTPGGGGFFPGPARPRVVWAGLAAGAAPCRQLASSVDAALVPVGFPAETRPFTAHLTLGRIKAWSNSDDADRLRALLEAVVWPAAAVQAMTLFASRPTSPGPHYTPLARFAATPS